METLILNSKSKSNLLLIAELAKKLGIGIKYLTEEEKEDMGLLMAIKKGRTKKYIDTENFVKKLQK